MPTYTEIGEQVTVLLADNTPVTVRTYNEYDGDTLVAENQKESQLENGAFIYCWHISNTNLMAQDTALEYLEPNSQSQSALPRPKTMSNPGGSPIKY